MLIQGRQKPRYQIKWRSKSVLHTKTYNYEKKRSWERKLLKEFESKVQFTHKKEVQLTKNKTKQNKTKKQTNKQTKTKTKTKTKQNKNNKQTNKQKPTNQTKKLLTLLSFTKLFIRALSLVSLHLHLLILPKLGYTTKDYVEGVETVYHQNSVSRLILYKCFLHSQPKHRCCMLINRCTVWYE